MPVPDMVSPHGASSDGSERPPPSSDAASTESSSSDIDPLENEYSGNQENEPDFGESLGLDVVMNEQSEPEVLETDSDCPHLRIKLGDSSFVKSYTAAITWRARSQMQGSADAESGAKRSKVSPRAVAQCFVLMM